MLAKGGKINLIFLYNFRTVITRQKLTGIFVVDLTRKEIVQKIIFGDIPSFEIVYRYYYPRLVYFARHYLLDVELSRNIVQDVFTELWDKRETLQEDTNLNAWLFTVTKNKSLKNINHQKSQQNYCSYIKARQLGVNFISLSEFDTNDFVLGELQSRINTALEKLSPACRKIFEMSRYDDKKNREIAEELHLSIKTVEAQISKALRLFKVDLRDYLPLLFPFFMDK